MEEGVLAKILRGCLKFWGCEIFWEDRGGFQKFWGSHEGIKYFEGWKKEYWQKF